MRWVWAETSGKDRLPERVAAKGRLIRCTVPGSTPNYLAMTRTPGRPGAARAPPIRVSSVGAIGALEAFTLSPDPRKPRHGLVPPSSLARTPVGIARTHETHIARPACAPNGSPFQPRFSEKVGPPDFQKIVKAPALLLYLRVRWRPLSDISRLPGF